jgi:hypothetical protein
MPESQNTQSPSLSFLALLTEDAACSEGRNAEQREVVRRWLRAVRLAHRGAKVTDEGPGIGLERPGEVATRNRVPHVWIELVEDPEAEALLERFGVKPSETPVTVWQGEDVLKNPTSAEFARTTGLEGGICKSCG